MASAYPTSTPTLVDRIRELAVQEGALPSRNRVMAQFHVGARKASDALAELAAPSPGPEPAETDQQSEPSAHVTSGADPGSRRVQSWPLVLLALPAFAAIWSGWVGLGELAGFGPIRPLPGIADGFTINTAITLPIGVETYAAYALHVGLGGHQLAPRARRFAKWSALAALALGALGQIAFHTMTAAGLTAAPWLVTSLVSCLPVVVLGCGAALRHLVHTR